jgi:hypothetical protein
MWMHHLRSIQTLKVTPVQGAMMTLGKVAMQSIARKQKMNVQSSTEGELVAVDNAATMILWTKLFLEAQGYNVDKNIVYQDKKSAILLETNGRKSSGKRTRKWKRCCRLQKKDGKDQHDNKDTSKC